MQIFKYPPNRAPASQQNNRRGCFSIRGGSVCQKASQSLRPQAQINCKSAFPGGWYVGKSTLQPASVEFSRLTPRKLCAQRAAFFCRRRPIGPSSTDWTAADASASAAAVDCCQAAISARRRPPRRRGSCGSCAARRRSFCGRSLKNSCNRKSRRSRRSPKSDGRSCGSSARPWRCACRG